MLSAPPPWFPIATERLLLREFAAEDLDDVHAYASDMDTVRFMEWGPNTPEISRERLRLTLEEQAVWPRREVNLAVEVVERKRVDPPPKKWTGLSRSALGLGWTDVAQG